MMPGSTVLIALSKALDVPISYFASPVQAELEGIEFRKKSGTSAQDRARVEAEVLQQVERYLVVEEILELDSAFWNSPLTERWVIDDFERCETLADTVREHWKLGNDPIPNMTQLLERHGIKVFVLALPKSVSGLTCLVHRPDKEKVPCIVVNRELTLERRRFTLAHELGHRLLESSSLDEEKICHRFAGALLMPREHLYDEVGKHRHALGYRELIQLKRTYRVSGAALLVRLEQLGILSHSAMVYAFKTFARVWRKEEPEPLESPSQQGGFERPKRFQRLCYRALSEGYISLPKAAELLQRPTDQIEADIKGPVAADADRY
jgi:Zn-dependent peptidase ImmA (M78 family)